MKVFNDLMKLTSEQDSITLQGPLERKIRLEVEKMKFRKAEMAFRGIVNPTTQEMMEIDERAKKDLIMLGYSGASDTEDII